MGYGKRGSFRVSGLGGRGGSEGLGFGGREGILGRVVGGWGCEGFYARGRRGKAGGIA